MRCPAASIVSVGRAQAASRSVVAVAVVVAVSGEVTVTWVVGRPAP